MERYDSYKYSGVEWIGEIPCHWDTVKVKYLGNIRSGDGLESNLIEDEDDYPVYGGNGVLGYYSDFNYSTNVLSIGRVGEKCGNVHFINKKVWINDNSLVLEPNSKVESLWYIFHSLTQRDLNQLRNKNTQPLITGTLVKNEYIPLPPKSEQHQIVSFLDTKTSLIDSLIDKTQRKIELLKEKRISLINEVVTKGLNPNVEMKDSGVEWIGEIPCHWDTVKVKYLGNIRSGDGLESNLIEDEDDYPVYGGNGVLGYYSDFNYSTNVLSIGRVGEKCGNVHFINKKVWINDNSLVLEPNSKVESLWYIFHSLTQRDLNQLRNKNTQPLITGTLVKNEYIPLPPKSEQHQIVEYLDEQTQLIDKTISIEEKRIELLKEYRQSLISEVVTGKRKVVV